MHFAVPAPEADASTTSGDRGKPAPKDAGSDRDSGAGSGGVDGGPPPIEDTDAGLTSAGCGGVDCGLHGDCVIDAMMNAPVCQCDKGYVVAGSSGCVEDKTCLEIRLIDCRSQYGSSGSAIGMTASVAYCSGNPYTGLRRKDLLIEEQGEDVWEPLLQAESLVTIVERRYVHHVYIVIDVSQSVRDSDVLDDVAAGIVRLLDAIEALPDDFRVAVYLFDGKPYLHDPPFVRETGNFAFARTALASLKTAPALDPRSTDLYGSVIRGLQKVERSKQLKSLVNDRGVLTTATLIVVSDGDDEAARKPFAEVKAAIEATPTRVVTVGLGDEANFPKLTELGRDGSYSAATPDLLDDTFDDIGAALAKSAESLYFIAYCSPKRAGTASARVSIKGFDGASVQCDFDADVFSSGCAADLFDPAKECVGRQCGSLIGCGECPSGKCCLDGQCVAPSFLTLDEKCGAEWMCEGPLMCTMDGCKGTAALDADCNPEACNPGESMCAGMTPDDSKCAAPKATGETCMTLAECATQHCGANPDYPASSSLICLAPLQMFESCGPSGEVGTCEPGAWCSAGACEQQVPQGVVCESNAECESGECYMGATGTKRCVYVPHCYFSFAP